MTRAEEDSRFAIDLLAQDVSEALARQQSEDTQFNRRVVVRALFSLTEAYGYFIRQFCLEIEHEKVRKGHPSNLERQVLLQERLPRIGSNGRIEHTPHRVGTADHLAFTLRVFADHAGVRANFFDREGWKALKGALQVRHRLTHPKERSDVEVSNADMELCAKGYAWFGEVQLDDIASSVAKR